jgi:hypothetical protein
MAQQTINIGGAYNDPDSDKVRDGFDKCNDNFTEVYQLTSGNASSISTLSGRVGASTHVQVAFSAWDMDTDASLNVAWTLPANKKIISLNVIIYPNGTTATAYPIEFDGKVYYNGTNVVLSRTDSGTFDSAGFNAASGVIKIEYDATTPA